jgi:hypothetical protein
MERKKKESGKRNMYLLDRIFRSLKEKGKIFVVFLFCFWLDRTTEFPHCREGRPPTSQKRLPPPPSKHMRFFFTKTAGNSIT